MALKFSIDFITKFLSDNGDDDDADEEDDATKIIYSSGSDNDDGEDEEAKEKDVYYLAMRICISEYNFQRPLSYYYIDTKDIPNNYEYDFKNYKII